MSKTIYVVLGECGEMSDHTLWLVHFFEIEGEAHRYAEALNEAMASFKKRDDEMEEEFGWYFSDPEVDKFLKLDPSWEGERDMIVLRRPTYKVEALEAGTLCAWVDTSTTPPTIRGGNKFSKMLLEDR